MVVRDVEGAKVLNVSFLLVVVLTSEERVRKEGNRYGPLEFRGSCIFA